jgi:stage IV sporulation protein A
MATQNIFHDIAKRTNGDIYIGVVGPCRTGKSTFISRFMRQMVVPKVENKAEQQRVIDELPQSGDGLAVMTTQPKFVPAKAVQIKTAGAVTMRVRMIDCVGYMIPGAVANHADGKVRLVKTPWSDSEMPFERAAEIGTKKVIAEHSTIAVMVTTDGTITEIPRANYLDAEERTIKELKKSGKPFVVIVNSKTPSAGECKKVCTDIANKHGVTVLPMDVEALAAEHINNIITAVLHEFGVCGFKVTMPKWLTVLDADHEIISEAVEALKTFTKNIKRLSDNDTTKVFEKSTNFERLETTNTCVATGIIHYVIVPKQELYYKVLSSESGVEIKSEQELVAFVKHMGSAKHQYTAIKDALSQAQATGYGVVAPLVSDYALDAPSLYKRGKDFGVRLRAHASSLHIIKVDVSTEVTPTIGSQAQSEEMLRAIQMDYDNDRAACWNTNIFGKPLQAIVQDGITTKATGMHPEAQRKIKRTLTKIVNNGRGGIICILL